MRAGFRTWLRRLSILPPLALGVAVLLWQLGATRAPPQEPPAEVVRTVRVIETDPVDFVPRAVGYGTVAPDRVWEAVAEVSGQIIEKHPRLERGRLLEAGTEILRIDPGEYELAVASAEADLESTRASLDELEQQAENLDASLAIEESALELAEEDLARKRRLLTQGNVPQSTVDQARTTHLSQRQRVQELENQLRLIPAERRVLEARLAQQETALARTELDLERTRIRLPFDARIADVNVEATRYVRTGDVLAVADSIARAEIDAQFAMSRLAPLVEAEIDLMTLSAAELAELPQRFGIGAEVRLRTGTLAASWGARFERLSDRIDPQTRTIGVIVTVDQPYRQAIPGRRPPLAKDMFVEVELFGQRREDVLIVPRVAVHRREDGTPQLYLADAEGRLEIRAIELGPIQGDLAVVTTGLEAGERVVVSDLIPAIAGMRLEPQPDAALAERLRIEAGGGPAVEAAVR